MNKALILTIFILCVLVLVPIIGYLRERAGIEKLISERHAIFIKYSPVFRSFKIGNSLSDLKQMTENKGFDQTFNRRYRLNCPESISRSFGSIISSGNEIVAEYDNDGKVIKIEEGHYSTSACVFDEDNIVVYYTKIALDYPGR